MNWQHFIEELKKNFGFEGSADDFDGVVSWLKEKGHNCETAWWRVATLPSRSCTTTDLGRNST